MNEKSIGRKIWVVRHGMRIDFTDSGWTESASNPYDPPLHSIGIEQARETAERFRNESIAWIFASPFLRTIQTANLIAAQLGIDFKLEDGLAEWLRTEEFEYPPVFTSLEILKKDYPRIDTHYQSCSPVRYPESLDELDSRVMIALDGITAQYSGDILIVTHASPVNSIFRVLAGIELDEFQGMAAVSCFEYTADGWKVVVDRDSSHLTTPDTTSRAFYQQWMKMDDEEQIT